MPHRPASRLPRDALLASLAALAVVAGHRLLVPAAADRPTVAEARAALEAALEADAADSSTDGGPVQTRVYDVRDLLRGPIRREAMFGNVDGPTGSIPNIGNLWFGSGEWSVRDSVALELARVLPLSDSAGRADPKAAGGRLILSATAAGHARVATMLAALRLAERARAGEEEPP